MDCFRFLNLCWADRYPWLVEVEIYNLAGFTVLSALCLPVSRCVGATVIGRMRSPFSGMHSYQFKENSTLFGDPVVRKYA